MPPKETHAPGLSRRDIFSFLLSKAPSSRERLSTQEEAHLPMETIRVGEMNVHALLAPHDRGSWNRYGAEIERQIGQFGTVIVEYRPSEYTEVENMPHPLVQQQMAVFREANYVFMEVERACTEQRKDVWVLDPAFDFDFAKLRMGLVGAEIAAEETALYIAATAAANLTTKRRPLLKAAIFGSGSLIIGGESIKVGLRGLTIGALDTYVENDLRNVVVAQHLHDLGRDELRNQDVLLMYPPNHWYSQDVPSIKTYLAQNERRGARFNQYKHVFSGAFPTFFQRRYYPGKHAE